LLGEVIRTASSLRRLVALALLAVVAGCVPGTTRWPVGALPDEVVDDLRLVATGHPDFFDPDAARRIGDAGDPRVAWVLVDALRFLPTPTSQSRGALDALEGLVGFVPTEDGRVVWVQAAEHLIDLDVPAPPDFGVLKASVYGALGDAWDAFLTDPDVALDLRHVSWGGVHPDLRPLGDASGCFGCIPALDHPPVTEVAGAGWLADDRVVFGVVLGGDARAYPRHMMEVHEMVNDALGGREIALAYCTLCGSAQAFLVDDVDGVDRLVLRTSGLLHRSNKIMFDLGTGSYFDTFAGLGVSGELRGTALTAIPVVTSTWGAWRAEHPDTTILAEDGGIARSYAEDPLGGRDLGGPIFPVGTVDGRLSAVERVLGVVTPDGVAMAFPVREAVKVLEEGGRVDASGIEVVLVGSGLRASLEGTDLASHEAFWFAWSQFHPDTAIWGDP